VWASSSASGIDETAAQELFDAAVLDEGHP
jgi:hypothetical protein